MLLGRMFWTDKGPKYLVMLIILSLVIYMFATLIGSANIAEDIGISSKSEERNLWQETVLDQISTQQSQLGALIEPLEQIYDEKDVELLRIVQRKFLLEPSKEDQNYNLVNPDPKFDTSMGQAKAVRQILKDKREGFFVECGAYDGETRSNTLNLERELGWSGVLIEADPVNLIQCFEKHRKAWLVPACLSTSKQTMFVKYRAWGNIGSILDHKELPKDNKAKQDPQKVINVNCIPFPTILRALNRTTVDYFSLDVEGNELDILRTIPFEEFDIKIISAEFSHESEAGSSQSEMKNFMEEKGYFVHSTVTHPKNLANDYIFVKNSFD